MASNIRPGRRSLSDKLRGMRFMKKKEESDIRDKLAAEQAAREKAAHWTLETADASNDTMPIVIIEEGLSDNPMLGRSGRQSFGNFNPRLEGKAKPEPSKVKEIAKEEGEIEDADVVFTSESLPKSSNRQRNGDKRDIYVGVRGGITKRENRALSHRNQFKKNRLHKGPRLSRPS